MPSTTSSSFSRPLPSSTVITPSFPTLSMASAMILPIASSALAEMAPTWAISLLVVQGFESFFSSSTTAITALSMPRFRSIGFMPEATNFIPSFTIDWASTVAVVVPSPATSEVLEATSFTICAPMFSNRFSSSISLATVTPSLVMVGEPKDFSKTTFRPLGPNVTFTASARILTPRRIASRALASKMISLAIVFLRNLKGGLLLNHSKHVFLAEDEVILSFDLDLRACVLAEEDGVASLDVERPNLSVLQHFAISYRDHFALQRFFLGAVGNDDSALGLVLLGYPLDDESVLNRPDFHAFLLECRGLSFHRGFESWFGTRDVRVLTGGIITRAPSPSSEATSEVRVGEQIGLPAKIP